MDLATASRGYILDFILVHGAELPVDIINYAVLGFLYHNSESPDGHEITTFSCLVEKFDARCRSQTLDGDNALCFIASSLNPKSFRGWLHFSRKMAAMYTPPLLRKKSYWNLRSKPTILSLLGLFWHSSPRHTPTDDAQLYHGDSLGNSVLHRLCA